MSSQITFFYKGRSHHTWRIKEKLQGLIIYLQNGNQMLPFIAELAQRTQNKLKACLIK